MLYREINDAVDEYHREFNENPSELFISFATSDELLKTKGLENQLSPFDKPASIVFGCPVYVVDMDEKYIWLSKNDLVDLRNRKPLENNWSELTLNKKSRSGIVTRKVPRSIVDFEYSKS